MPAYTPVRMPSRAVSAIEAAAPSGVVTAAADSGVGPGAGGSSFDARDRVQVERLAQCSALKEAVGMIVDARHTELRDADAHCKHCRCKDDDADHGIDKDDEDEVWWTALRLRDTYVAATAHTPAGQRLLNFEAAAVAIHVALKLHDAPRCTIEARVDDGIDVAISGLGQIFEWLDLDTDRMRRLTTELYNCDPQQFPWLRRAAGRGSVERLWVQRSGRLAVAHLWHQWAELHFLESTNWAPASETPFAYRDALDHDADDEEASETFKLMFTDSLYYATVLRPHLVGYPPAEIAVGAAEAVRQTMYPGQAYSGQVALEEYFDYAAARRLHSARPPWAHGTVGEAEVDDLEIDEGRKEEVREACLMGLAECYERHDATMPRVGAPFVYDPPTGQLPRRRSRLSPAKAADEGERSEWGGEMTDASCDTDTLEIDSDEDEW